MFVHLKKYSLLLQFAALYSIMNEENMKGWDRMAKRDKLQFSQLQIEFVCPGCGKHLAWALPDAIIGCPVCGKWVTKKNRKIQNEVFLPIDSNQLVLFT